MWKMKLGTFLGVVMFLGTFSSTSPSRRITFKGLKEKVFHPNSTPKEVDTDYYLRKIDLKMKSIDIISDSIKMQQKILNNDQGNNIANF